MRLIITLAALASIGTLAYTVWSKKEEKKQLPPAEPVAPLPCPYTRVASVAWANTSQPNYVVFEALNRNGPPPWAEQMQAGWGAKMVEATLSGYGVLLITVPEDGLNPRFWVAGTPIGPSGPTWVERKDFQASYCKSLRDKA